MSSIIKREYIEVIIFIIGLAIAVCIALATLPKKGDVVVINCSISEISPDFTTEMREACRQARTKEIQNSLQKPK